MHRIISHRLIMSLVVVSMTTPVARAQEHEHEAAGHSHDDLHFTHPLIAESISPDTKIRVDHQFFDFPDGDEENSGVIEAEYAFHRSFSIEAGIPYSYTAGEVGNLEVLLKFANYAFEEASLLLGYGVAFGFPTNSGEAEPEVIFPDRRTPVVGDPRFALALSGGGGGVEGTLGSDEFEVEPFLNIGFKRGRVELIAWGLFGIPFNQEAQDEVAAELAWNLSGMVHVSPRIQALLEFDGSGGVSGEAVGEDVANVAPGLRVQLLPTRPLVLGVSAGFPLANEEPFDTRIKTSLFWHF